MSSHSSDSHSIPSSNHSLYTPSYHASSLIPIQCPELDLEPSLPISRPLKPIPSKPSKPQDAKPRKSSKVRDSKPAKHPSFDQNSERISSSIVKFSKSSIQRDPIQYQKLKMNYLRRLNVIPIISHKDVLAVLGETPKQGSLNSLPQQTEPVTKKKDQNESSGKRFVPSFLPSKGVASRPIPIPPRSKKTSQVPYVEDIEKGLQPSSMKAASLIPDHFGVFFQEFEL